MHPASPFPSSCSYHLGSTLVLATRTKWLCHSFLRTNYQLYDVMAFASLDNGTITNVLDNNYSEANNVSGLLLNTIPYNGYLSLSDTSHLVKFRACLYSLIFNTSTNVNVQAREISIRSAIFCLAQQSRRGLDFASKIQSRQLRSRQCVVEGEAERRK